METLDREGFAIIPDAASASDVTALIAGVSRFESQAGVREKGGSAYAVRRLCEAVPAIAAFAASHAIRALVELELGPSARVVRSLLFDKNPAANWKVPWHQDITIAVKERRDIFGFGPWSVKAEIPHVQPPLHILESMLTVRLHLDDCGVVNGPLRVIPGSHRLGLLGAQAIGEIRGQHTEVICTVPRGGVLLMRPLLLHASSPAEIPGHRRVVHLEFAAGELPGGLIWHES